MNDILEIENIINRKQYPKIYNLEIIISIIVIIFIYIIFTYKYETYYCSYAKTVDNKLELKVNIDNLKYIKNNYEIEIDGNIYPYYIDYIDRKLSINNKYQNYQYVYIKVPKLNITTNDLVYYIKISKENKTIAKYLKDNL